MTHAPANSTLIRRHLLELERRSLSEGTTMRRRQVLERLAEHADRRSLLDIGHQDVHRFLDAREIGPRTRYHLLSNIHQFYEWAVREGLTAHDPTLRIIRPKLPRLMPRPIGDDDLDRAIKAAPATMRCWLTLCAYAGLRCAEISRMDASDVLLGDRLLLVRGKGNVERLVPMHAKVEAELRSRSLPRSGPVFVRARGSRFAPAMVSREISLYLDDLGIGSTAHSLRHWFGTRAYQSCKDLRAVQELLGHANPVTTTIYTKFDPGEGRKAVDGLG